VRGGARENKPGIRDIDAGLYFFEGREKKFLIFR
jgi:hypothetical protein